MSLVFYSLRGFLKTHTHLQENLYIGLFLFGGHVLTSRRINLFAYLGLKPNEGQHEKLETRLLPGNSNFVCATKATYPSAMMHFKNCYLQDASLGKLKIEKKKADLLFPMTHPWDWYIYLYMNGWFFMVNVGIHYHTWIRYDPLGFVRKGTRIDNVEWTWTQHTLWILVLFQLPLHMNLSVLFSRSMVHDYGAPHLPLIPLRPY